MGQELNLQLNPRNESHACQLPLNHYKKFYLVNELTSFLPYTLKF